MNAFRPLIALLAVSVCSADPALDTLLRGVETRYNKTKTLQVLFHEDYTPPGRSRRSENGTLLLRKPGRMRWDYSQPKGKLFVSDGKYLWIYTPADNRAEKMKFKESEDMRAPLAFLLGKLNFDKEFRNLQAHAEGDATRISGEPKNDVYAGIEFLVAPDKHIEELKIIAVDHSILDFSFSNEKRDPPMSDKLFAFQLPAGAQWDEGNQ